MAKILISSIGTGGIKKDCDNDYVQTKYILEDKIYDDESLMSKVLIKHYDIDKVFFIGTNKSMWDNLYYYFNGLDEAILETLSNKKSTTGIDADDLPLIASTIDTFLENTEQDSRCFLIDYAQNSSEEIWDNFEKLLDMKELIQEGDEIYLDITHGFRYMPILNIFLLEFLSIFKSDSFHTKGIFYGMFSGEHSEIIDFKVFFDLLDWAKAVNMFKHNSNADLLIQQLANEDEPEIQKIFTQFNNNLQLANMSSLWQFMRTANKKIKKLQSSENKIIKLLSKDLIEITARLDKEEQSLFQYELALWLHENKNYALSYLALSEAIVTRTCEIKGYSLDQEGRKEAKNHVDYPYDKMFLEKLGRKDENRDSISSIRNNIAHQLDDRKDKVNQDIKVLAYYLEEFQSYFYK